GGVCVGVVLAPFALPYFAARRELGFERHLFDSIEHRAYFATFFYSGSRNVVRISRFSNPAETSTFVGFTALALAAVGLVWLRRDPPLPRRAARLARLVTLGLLLTLPVLAWVVHLPP